MQFLILRPGLLQVRTQIQGWIILWSKVIKTFFSNSWCLFFICFEICWCFEMKVTALPVYAIHDSINIFQKKPLSRLFECIKSSSPEIVFNVDKIRGVSLRGHLGPQVVTQTRTKVNQGSSHLDNNWPLGGQQTTLPIHPFFSVWKD